VEVICDPGDTPQDVADAVAQALFDLSANDKKWGKGLPPLASNVFAASSVDTAGTVTALTAPTPS
jgi:hypothetical protein